MGDSGSVLINVLGISSAVVILALVGGVVFAEIFNGPQCSSGVRGNLIIEPDLSEITAKSPVEALEESIAEDGAGYVGLHDVAGSTSELAAGFEPVPANQDEVSEGGQVFEYKDESGNVIARVQVEPIGDGRYFVGSAQSCGGKK
jgi:hypothetical protein